MGNAPRRRLRDDVQRRRRRRRVASGDRELDDVTARRQIAPADATAEVDAAGAAAEALAAERAGSRLARAARLLAAGGRRRLADAADEPEDIGLDTGGGAEIEADRRPDRRSFAFATSEFRAGAEAGAADGRAADLRFGGLAARAAAGTSRRGRRSRNGPLGGAGIAGDTLRAGDAARVGGRAGRDPAVDRRAAGQRLGDGDADGRERCQAAASAWKSLGSVNPQVAGPTLPPRLAAPVPPPQFGSLGAMLPATIDERSVVFSTSPPMPPSSICASLAVTVTKARFAVAPVSR
jgi:hypothetical protein